MMKHAIAACLIVLVASLAFGVEATTLKERSELIHDLPTREQLTGDMSRLRMITQPNIALLNEQQREAVTRLERAKEGYGRLKTLLRAGTSVFDYPGLLSLAQIRYDQNVDSYSMRLGIPLPRPPISDGNAATDRRTGENEFEIVFDKQGVITELRH